MKPLEAGPRRWMVTLVIFCVAVLLRAQPEACQLSIHGTVSDDHDRTPLSYAEVWLPDLNKGAVSDADGRFSITGLCAGTYTVRVAHLGCEPVERRVVLLDRNVTLDLKLEHHTEELRELEVIRMRPDENVGASRATLDGRAMGSSVGKDIASMLAVLPGVTLLNSGPTIAKPMIHGLYGNRVLILNQGIRQEDQQWGTEHAPNLDPFSSDRITVVKGAASVQYGADAIGGVVITEPLELPRQGKMSGEVSVVGLLNGLGGGGGGHLQGAVKSIPGLGWRVQGTTRQKGDSRSPNYVLSNTGMRELGASGAVGLKRHWGGLSVYYSYFGRELGVLRASHIGNLTDLRNAIESGEPWFQAPFTYSIDAPRQTVQHHLAKAEANYRISDRDQVVITYGYQADDRQEFDIRRGGRTDRQATDLLLTTHTADVTLKHWLGPHVHGKVGVNGVAQDNYNVPGTGIRPLLPDHTKESIGAYILEHIPVNDRLELEAGVRLEGTRIKVQRFDADNVLRTPEHRFQNHALSAGLNWTMSDSVRLRANISSAFRPPHVSELYSEGLHHGSAAIERGDPTLQSERAFKGAMDLEGSWFKGRTKATFTFHAGRINNFIYLRPSGYQLTIRGAFPVFDYVATDVWIHGMDGALEQYLVHGLAWRVRFSVVRARDRGANEWLFQMPADRITNEVVFRRPAKGAWSGLEFAMEHTYVARQGRFPVGVDFMEVPDAYHLVGASFSVERAVGTNALRLGLRGSNLFNARYRDLLDRFRYYADARGTDVSLWLRFSFGAR